MTEQTMIDINREKVYKGDHEKIHYERFEDTIKYIVFDAWIMFLQFVKEFDDKHRIRNILIFRLLISTGMRVKEFYMIKVADLDFKSSMINVPFENTKTKRRRTARVNKTLMLDLKEYMYSNGIKSGYVFRNSKNNFLSTRSYQKIFDKYFCHQIIVEGRAINLYDHIGIGFKPHPHTFRHCHVVFSLQAGVPINAVMSQVGHLSMKTTEIYSKLAGVDVAKGYEGVEF